MDTNDAAAHQQSATLAAQYMMCGLSDRPEQFREPPLSALFRQAYQAASGHDAEISYLTVPF